MKAKEFMEQVGKAERDLLAIRAHQRHLMDLATAIGVNLTGMPGKQGGSSRVENVVSIIDLTVELADKEREYTQLVVKAKELIGKIPQEKFQNLLILKYLCDHSWKTIRDEMGYKDEKSVFRCHGYALKALQKLL